MAKYRKKPVVIEAVQWFPGSNLDDVVEKPDRVDPATRKLVPAHGLIKTLEGWMTVSSGDWVITGVAGEKYPCKDEIFQQTYDPV